jgi:hypothetical protein
MLYKCVFVSLERIKFFKNIISDNLVTIDSIPKKGKESLFNKKRKENKLRLVIYLCIYHPLIILFLWSYYRTMFKSAIGPPREVKIIYY